MKKSAVKRSVILFGVVWITIYVLYAIFALAVGAFSSPTIGWAIVLVLALYTTINTAFVALLFFVATAIVAAFRKRTGCPSDDKASKEDENDVRTDSTH